jgi:hypothetical protein
MVKQILSKKNKIIIILLAVILVLLVGIFAWLSYVGQINLGAQTISQKGKVSLVKFYQKGKTPFCDINFNDKIYSGLNMNSVNFIPKIGSSIQQIDYKNKKVKEVVLQIYLPNSLSSISFRFNKIGQALNIPSVTNKVVVLKNYYQKDNKNYASIVINDKNYEVQENSNFANNQWYLGKIDLKRKTVLVNNKLDSNVNIGYALIQNEPDNLYSLNYNLNAGKNMEQLATTQQLAQKLLNKDDIDKISDPAEKIKQLKNLALGEIDSNPEEAADLLSEAEGELEKITDEAQKQQLTQEINDAKGQVEAEKQKLDQGKEDVAKTIADAKTVQSKQVAGGGTSNSKSLKVFGVTAGGMVGGAAIGAGIGSAVPGIGTAIGGIGGGIIGGLAGLIGGLFGF